MIAIELSPLPCDFLLDDVLILLERLLYLFVGQLALFHLLLALVLQCVHLLQQHLPARLFLLINKVRPQRLCDLLLDLCELGISLSHYFLGHLRVVVLQFPDRLQLFYVFVDLLLVSCLKLIPTQELALCETYLRLCTRSMIFIFCSAILDSICLLSSFILTSSFFRR